MDCESDNGLLIDFALLVGVFDAGERTDNTFICRDTMLDIYKNAVIDFRISDSDIEDMAREMGALREYEEMEQE